MPLRATDKDRVFLDGGGKRYVGVTTALGALPKEYLIGWAANVTADAAVEQHAEIVRLIGDPADPDAQGLEKARQMLRKARWKSSGERAELGSHVHAAVDQYVKAGVAAVTLSDTDPAYPYIQQFVRFLADFKPEVVASEALLVHHTHRWAGRCDLIATVNGKTFVFDYKIGRAYDNTAVQLAAYREAERMEHGGVEFPMTRTDGGAVVVLHPDSYEVVPMVTDGLYDVFLTAMRSLIWRDTTSKTVVLPAVTSPDALVAAIGKVAA